MIDIKLDGEKFKKRCKRIHERIGKPLLVMLGKTADAKEFRLNSGLFCYLLNYEFSETVIIVKEDPVLITSQQKALIFEQIRGIKIIVRKKDYSDVGSIFSGFNEVFGVVDVENIRGEFCSKVLKVVKHCDMTESVLDALCVKDAEEIGIMKLSGKVVNYLIDKGIELVREMNFSKETLENYMNDDIPGIVDGSIDYSFEPEYSEQHVRLGVRYNEYCVEIARKFMCDADLEYKIEEYAIDIVACGLMSGTVLEKVVEYAKSQGYDGHVSMYTLGLLEKERDFNINFELCNGMVFVLNLNCEFCNTFVIEAGKAKYVTRRDNADKYTVTSMRFRKKNKDIMVLARIKENQKELFERLIEDQIEYYKANTDTRVTEEQKEKHIERYEESRAVPRGPGVFLDWNRMYVVVPLLSYAVPFHISVIKNVAVMRENDKLRLRINFKSDNLKLENSNTISDQNDLKNDQTDEINLKSNISNISTSFDTFVKTITVETHDADLLLGQINDMKKEFSKPKAFVDTFSGNLADKVLGGTLYAVYMRSDVKMAIRKTVANLELYSNGLKYGETIVMFSNVKHIFYIQGDNDNKAMLHINLKKPVGINGKPTSNLQFFKKFGTSCQDTNKRNDERLEKILMEEEAAEIARINDEFETFVDKIDNTKQLRVQFPERGFIGVHTKESVNFMVTRDCIISVADMPFFVLNFNEVEIVNFERITFLTKTFDCVFVFKNKTRGVVAINSIDNSRLLFIKELLDSRGIVFMETKVSINWNNLIASIMENPLSFYENGGWAELMRDDEDEEETEEESTEFSDTNGTLSTTTSTLSDTDESYEAEEDDVDNDDVITDDDYSTEEEEETRKPVKKQRK